MSNGDTIEYSGKSTGTLTVSEELSEREYIIENIKTRLRENIPSVEVTSTDQGIVINVGEILFKFDSDELTKNASDDLNNIVDVLRDFPERKIRVIGHTDSTGPEDYNLSLSLRRARRTTLELKSRNPDLEGRITYIGLGESKPLASNETEEGRRKNRRVEIIILNP
jgi:OOP family OmpA-OmpF porin